MAEVSLNASCNMEGYDLAYAKKAMMVLVTLPLIVMYTEAVLIPVLPNIQYEFNVTPSMVSWVLTIFLLTGTISAALFGKLGDLYGKKKLFLTALTIYTIGVAATGFAPSFHLLLASRALQGLGMAIFPLGFTIVREEFPPRMVPQVQGMISAMFGVGIAVALPVGSWIAQHYGWRMTYHTVVPFTVAVLIASALVLRESRCIKPGRMDWLGLLLLAVFATSGLVAVTRAPTIGWRSPETLSLIIASIIALIMFIQWEKHVEDPLLPVNLLAAYNVLASNIGILLAGFAVQMINQAVIYMLQGLPPYGYGKTIFQSGLLMTPYAIVMLVVAPIAGKLMTRIGARPVAIAGSILAVAGLLLMAYHPLSKPLWSLVLLVSLVGTSITVLNVSLINVLVFSVPREYMGAATGVNTVFRNLGASWGPAVAGSIMTMYLVTVWIPTPAGDFPIKLPDAKAYTVLFVLSSLLYLVLTPVLARIREVVKQES